MNALVRKLAQQAASLRRRCDRPQAKRGANREKSTDHHPPRLQPRPDEARTRPPANRSAAGVPQVNSTSPAARSAAARRSQSSCLTARSTLPARTPERGRPCPSSTDHHRRAEQRGQTKRRLLLDSTTGDTRPKTSAHWKPQAKQKPQRADAAIWRKDNWVNASPQGQLQMNANAALSRCGTIVWIGRRACSAIGLNA
jgi:hypothetical protein